MNKAELELKFLIEALQVAVKQLGRDVQNLKKELEGVKHDRRK